jgi:hypothetical protein
MRVLSALLVVVAFSVGLACGGGGSSSGTPVKAQVLAGSIDGQSWTVQSATLEPAFSSGDRFLNLYSTVRTCDDFSPPTAPSLLTSVQWKVGTLEPQQITFVVPKPDGGAPNNIVTFGQRLEILTAPDAGTGTIRLRATDGSAANSVEGEATVTVCPGF